MKKKKTLYSIIGSRLGTKSLTQLKNDSSDSLAAITHALQSRSCEPRSLIRDRIEYQHLVSLSTVIQQDHFRYDPDQKEFPFSLEKLLEFPTRFDVPFPPPGRHRFTFIDLFAGIGGMRLAFQSLGGKCVFSSEIDPYAKQTYEVNFGEVPFGDITKIDGSDIPDHNVLVGGFPCQAFSIAGKRMGFEETRGTLFFDIARIIDAKRPSAFFLENVKGLKNHKGGETLRVILKILRDDLGYTVPDPQIMNAKYFGVPQNRERVFIVGFRHQEDASRFKYPKQDKVTTSLKDILESVPVDAKYYLSQRYLDSIREHRRRHEELGHGFGYEIIQPSGIANAIVVGGMGRERNLIIDHKLIDRTPTTNIKGEVNRENVRRMTPREWARLQGFPDDFLIPVSDAQAYKQFGNSVAVPAIKMTAKRLIESLAHEAEHRRVV
jgi:DNA (cytosine-5)-methyltransferase 1